MLAQDNCYSCKDVHTAIVGLQSFMGEWFRVFHEDNQRQSQFLEQLVDLFQKAASVSDISQNQPPGAGGVPVTVVNPAPPPDEVPRSRHIPTRPDVVVPSGHKWKTILPATNTTCTIDPSVNRQRANGLANAEPQPASAFWNHATTEEGIEILLEPASEAGWQPPADSSPAGEGMDDGTGNLNGNANQQIHSSEYINAVSVEVTDEDSSGPGDWDGTGQMMFDADELMPGPSMASSKQPSKSALHAKLFPPHPKPRRSDSIQYPVRFVPLESVSVYNNGKSVTYIIEDFVYFVNKRFKNRDDLYLRCREAKRQCSASCLLTPESCKLMGAPHNHGPPPDVGRYREEAQKALRSFNSCSMQAVSGLHLAQERLNALKRAGVVGTSSKQTPSPVPAGSASNNTPTRGLRVEMITGGEPGSASGSLSPSRKEPKIEEPEENEEDDPASLALSSMDQHQQSSIELEEDDDDAPGYVRLSD